MSGKKSNRKKNTRRSRKKVFRPQRILAVGFPRTTAVKLRYVQHIQINPAVGVLGTHYFRANSCFGPNATSSGHQPNGFDQWREFYNHYVVVGSKCRATFARDTATSGGGMSIVGVNLADDVTTTTDLTLMLEQSLSKRKSTYNSIDANKPKTVTKGFSAKKFFNITNVLDNIGRVGSLVSDNPTEQAYFAIFVGDPNIATDPPNYSVLVEIEYIVVFSEPKELAQS